MRSAVIIRWLLVVRGSVRLTRLRGRRTEQMRIDISYDEEHPKTKEITMKQLIIEINRSVFMVKIHRE